jgi:hypothetical protein
VLPYASLLRKLASVFPLVVVLRFDDFLDSVDLILQGFVLSFEFVNAVKQFFSRLLSGHDARPV